MEVVVVAGGEGDAGGGEEEWVEWIMERRSGSSGGMDPLVSEFCI